jgi:hypothetical protein
MSEKIQVQLGNGCAVMDDYLAVAGFPVEVGKDERFTRIFFLSFQIPSFWGHRDWSNQTVVSLCLRAEKTNEKRAVCSLSNEGFVRYTNSTEEIIEKIPGAGLRDLEDGMPIVGYVQGIAEVGGTLFVCGGFGQTYRRGSDGWKAIDGGLVARASALQSEYLNDLQSGRDTFEEKKVATRREGQPMFNEIAGFSETDVYTCGMYGHLYHFNGKGWQKTDSGTSEHLLGMHCVSPDEIIIAGYGQTLLSGNALDGFRVLHHQKTNTTFWSVRKFQGQIFVATAEGLWRFNRTGFDVIRNRDIGFDETTVLHKLDSVSDNYLWIVSDRHVFRYDGEIVERFQHPDNI